MALSKTVTLFNNQVSLVGAYHKIVRVKFTAEGIGPPKITGIVNVYKDKDSSDANLAPLEQVQFEFTDAENAIAEVDAFRTFLYDTLKLRERFAGSVDV